MSDEECPCSHCRVVSASPLPPAPTVTITREEAETVRKVLLASVGFNNARGWPMAGSDEAYRILNRALNGDGW